LDIGRVIFEKGIEISHGEDGVWFYKSSLTKQSVANRAEVSKKYSARPILLSTCVAAGDKRQITLLFPTEGNQVLELEQTDLQQMAIVKDIPMIHQFNLNYIIGAVVYHCKRLAERYSEICSTFSQGPTGSHHRIDRAIFSGQFEAYYEFEALITAATRAYDTTRHVLWRAFGGRGSVPSSFERTLRLCDGLPMDLDEQLHLSWAQFGTKIKDYRDCIQHYVPIGGPMSAARMVKLQGDIWSTTLWIPNNPEARSHKKFRYDSEIDALTYGWELTNEMLEIAHKIVQAVPEQDSSQ
jgi:hypothetical protein